MTDTVRDILLAFVRVHVLYHAVSERVYGAGMAEELARHGYQLSPGTLYPLLHRLEEDGLLKSSVTVVHGKQRRYYVATAKGRKALEALRPKLAELTDETLHKAPNDGLKTTPSSSRHQP
ncbi:PadR family transcriptional regulator [Comamonas sp. SY3]|uniref:PadR family transcriptional regulator n=1 Tax=Comamonas sp. SY3 TaxID=3243601 RepID=UPI003593C7FF